MSTGTETRRCDVLVIGGGPAGSSCAHRLKKSGLDVVVLDRKTFPRDKICAGWVTPQILEALAIDPAEYAAGGRVMQPIHGFRLSRLGDKEAVVDHQEMVSWAIRRYEFDHFLLERTGADLWLGERIVRLARTGGAWRVETERGLLEAPALVGAGGHFCPVARHLGVLPGRGEPVVVATEVEFEMTAAQAEACPVDGRLPELFFTRDLAGYGWVVRKGNWLNVGLGRQDPAGLPAHEAAFLAWLKERGRIPADHPRLKGHAYLLHGQAPRPLSTEGVLLVGDAAGLAYDPSGEGIRPAVETGLMAADAVVDSGGWLGAAARNAYAAAVEARFGSRRDGRKRRRLTDWLPGPLRGPVAGRVLAFEPFARAVVVDDWFLHRNTPAYTAARPV